MKVAVLFCVAVLVLADFAAAKKPKRPKPPKKIPPHIIAKFEYLSGAIGQLQQNVSALWAKLDEMSGMDRQSSGGVHIHARDGHVDHVHGDDGQHLHMHMHIDSGCDDHHGHGHDGRRHDRMHAHANTREEIHAHCEMKPNPSLSPDYTTRVTGHVHLHQQANGGPLHVDVNLSGFDVSGDHAHHVHGFHIHEFGDLTDGCGSLGGHYDVSGSDHGSPNSDSRHTGDFGNIMCNDEGIVEKHFTDHHASLVGSNSIIGRSIVIHRHEDDMGMNDTPASKSSGDAGPRIACCVIGRSRSNGNATIAEEHHRQFHHGDHHHDDHDHNDHDNQDHGDHNHGEHDHGNHNHGEHDHGNHNHGEHDHGNDDDHEDDDEGRFIN